jgi:tripartite-type tricarboxylate transporter receptor subunit TctC
MLTRTICKNLVIAALTANAAAFSSSLLAQSYPSKPINVVVPYPAGGAADYSARVITKEMINTLKQPMIIDNVPGAAGALGTLKVLNAPADGYNILVSSPIELILSPLAISAAKYKPDDLRTAAILGKTETILLTRKDLGVNTLEELVALAKSRADKPLSYCTPGIGSLYHLMGEKFNIITGTKNLHAPYTGLPQCVTNVVGGQIDFTFVPIAGPFPGFIDNGSMKAIAVAANSASPRFPKVPLAKATKGFEDFSFSIWQAIHVSAKTPDGVVLALNKSAYAALATPEVKKTFEATGATLFDAMSLAEANAFYVKEAAFYQSIAKSINLQQQ